MNFFPFGLPMLTDFLKTNKQTKNPTPGTVYFIKCVLIELKTQISIKQMIVGDFKTTLSTVQVIWTKKEKNRVKLYIK